MTTMKIAYITQSYPPMISGAAIVVQKLAEGMVSRGHSSLVIAASDRGETYTLEFGNLKTIRLKSITNPKRAYQKFVPISFRRIFKELKDFQPEIIHTHDVLSLGIAGIFVGHALDIPVIATIHQLPWFISAYLPAIPGLKHLIERSLWSYSQWLNKQCETMIVPTSTIARIIERRGGFVTQVISNGVDLTHFNPMPSNHSEEKYLRRKYNIDDKCSIILHVGRLDIDKNVDLVIRAAAKAMRKSDANLLIVGDGKCRKSLIQLAKNEGIPNRSKFPGFIEPKTDLPGIYRMADVFITASEIETQGLVVLEAMASGLPVVAVEATCIPEVVKHNFNGYLSSPGNVTDLADYLVKILNNPARARQMGESGRKYVQNHSIENTLEKQEKIYKMVIHDQHQQMMCILNSYESTEKTT